MKMIGRYASTTNKVRFDDEYEIELLYDENGEEATECVDITEVVYLHDERFVVDETITYETGKVVFATHYNKDLTMKKELQLTSDWYAKEYSYTLTVWKL